MRAAAAILLACVVSAAEAESRITATAMQIPEWCKDDAELTRGLYCAGMAAATLELAPDIKDGERRIVCLPKGVTNGQLMRMAVKRANERPDQLHFSIPTFMALALAESFPCAR